MTPQEFLERYWEGCQARQRGHRNAYCPPREWLTDFSSDAHGREIVSHIATLPVVGELFDGAFRLHYSGEYLFLVYQCEGGPECGGHLECYFRIPQSEFSEVTRIWQ